MLLIEMEEAAAEKKPKIKFSWKVLLLVIVFTGIAGGGVYYYLKYRHTQALLRDPSAAATEEIKQLVARVSQHIVIGTQETPVIAKVTDINQLAENPAFAQAKTGDMLLIFQEANKAVLFRPDIDRIVNIISPIRAQQEVAGTSTASAQLQTAELTIYNGTNTVGLAGVADKKIKELLPEIQTLAKVNAKGIYKESIVVVLNTQAQDLGTRLKDLLKAGITTNLPADETKPETDLLLIVGEDFKP